MLEKFNELLPVSADKWDEYVSRLTRVQVPARTVLLHEGDISRRAYLVEKGCLRVWFNNRGNQAIYLFVKSTKKRVYRAT